MATDFPLRKGGKETLLWRKASLSTHSRMPVLVRASERGHQYNKYNNTFLIRLSDFDK